MTIKANEWPLVVREQQTGFTMGEPRWVDVFKHAGERGVVLTVADQDIHCEILACTETYVTVRKDSGTVAAIRLDAIAAVEEA